MPVTGYHEDSQDFMTHESQSESVHDGNFNFELDSSDIIPESSSAKKSSQLSTTYIPNDTKYLIIIKDELSQVRATAILERV